MMIEIQVIQDEMIQSILNHTFEVVVLANGDIFQLIRCSKDDEKTMYFVVYLIFC